MFLQTYKKILNFYFKYNDSGCLGENTSFGLTFDQYSEP